MDSKLIRTAFPCPVEEWADAEGKSLSAIARLAGVPEPSLINYRNRRRGLSRLSMQKLAEASKGRVSGLALLFWQLGMDPAAGAGQSIPLSSADRRGRKKHSRTSRGA